MPIELPVNRAKSELATTRPRPAAVQRPLGWPGTARDQGRDQGIDLAEIWAVIRERWRVIAFAAVLLALAAVVFTLFSRMQFRANGSLYLGELQGKGGAATSALPDQLEFLGGRIGEVSTEVEILKSRDLVTRALLLSGMNAVATPYGWTPPRYGAWRFSGRDGDLMDAGYRRIVAVNTVAPGHSRPKTVTVRFLDADRYDVFEGKAPLGVGSLGHELVAPGLRMTLVAGVDGPPVPGAVYGIATIVPRASLGGDRGAADRRGPQVGEVQRADEGGEHRDGRRLAAGRGGLRRSADAPLSRAPPDVEV